MIAAAAGDAYVDAARAAIDALTAAWEQLLPSLPADPYQAAEQDIDGAIMLGVVAARGVAHHSGAIRPHPGLSFPIRFPITFSATWPLLSGLPNSVWDDDKRGARRRRYKKIENLSVESTLQRSADYLTRLVSPIE